MRRSGLLAAGLMVLAIACDITGPHTEDQDTFFSFVVTGGGNQIGLPGTTLDQSIAVQLKDINTSHPVANREVQFRAPAGSGIQLTPAVMRTDEDGRARADVKLGEVYGRHTIEVDFAENPSIPRKVTVEVADAPVITSVTPADVRANEEITISGHSFGAQAEWNEVRIDNVRAEITQASTTALRARVPRCVADGSVSVRVHRGALESEPMSLTVAGGHIQLADLKHGEALLPAPEQYCVRTAAQQDEAQYLVMPLSAAMEGSPSTYIRLVGASGGRTVLAQEPIVVQARDVRGEFDAKLRGLEAQLLPRIQARSRAPQRALRVAPPQIGDRRSFNVISPPWWDFITVNAVVRGVGRTVAVYVDAQARTLASSDLGELVQLFDDLIYPTDVSVYGEPSDLDNNGRVAILLTPVVNRMTPPGSNGYIAGFFYGCDLVSAIECPGSNEGEVLYSLVPDPSGTYGLQHSRESVLRTLKPVAAHELMHAIHFNQRVLVNGVREAEPVWLSEALAHSAEDTVSNILRGRGRLEEADAVARDNYLRASLFLSATESTNLVATYGGGTLEERGGGWLLLKYLQARIGGDILGKLTRARSTGAQNIMNITNIDWSELVHDFSIALYASGAPELAGSALRISETFGPFDLRAATMSVNGGKYPLVPRQLTGTAFQFDVQLQPSSASYLLLSVPAGEELSLMLTGTNGRPLFPVERASLAILRVR